ncbi:MAG TPA: hypothetical protein VMT17_18815 [Anaeromyxobacteraceae bacterium]|nr:hypothetical protein [Anaeromyxobacteraceae bacterium]
MASASEKGGARAGPSQVAPPPLEELSRDELSVFLYVALLPEETRAIVKELGLSIPGFRSTALGDVERCDVIADEILAHPPTAEAVQRALSKAFEVPPLAHQAMAPEAWAELLSACAGDAALALALWRVLSDRDAEVRAAARPVLDDLAKHYYGPAPGEEPVRAPREEGEDPAARAERLAEALRRAEEALKESDARGAERAEEARRKGEEQREALKASLREARARESTAVEEAARSREEEAAARREAARLKSELEVLRASDAAVEERRLRAELREVLGRANALESRLERAQQRAAELEGELERARSGEGDIRPVGPAPGLPEAAAEGLPGESEANWLMPIYTREFYDSLEGWDRRIQRAAFKQAHLLALDHRHPSLRALPLEGLPGYYRVRVATDVRLIYRRAERQNSVEILSLIDREDLDRYIRQAKTRG